MPRAEADFYTSSAANLATTTGRSGASPTTESEYYGLRLGSVVVPGPTPVVFVFCTAGALSFLGRLRRRCS